MSLFPKKVEYPFKGHPKTLDVDVWSKASVRWRLGMRMCWEKPEDSWHDLLLLFLNISIYQM